MEDELDGYTCDSGSLSRIINKNGSRVTPENAHAFAIVLNVRSEYLLGKDDFPTNDYIPSQLDIIRDEMTEEERKDNACRLLIESLGFKIIEDIDGKSIEAPYKKIVIGTNASQIEIDKCVKEAVPPKMAYLISPDGKNAKYIEGQTLLDLFTDIREYTALRCSKIKTIHNLRKKEIPQ